MSGMNAIFCCVIFWWFFEVVVGRRLKDLIYVPLYDGEYACFRLLNGTHQMGCQTERSGSTGVVHLIETEEDVKFVLNGFDAPGVKFIVAMELEYFKNLSLMLQLRDSGTVAGVLLLHQIVEGNETTSNAFSEDYACPNEFSGLYKSDSSSSCPVPPWNTVGTAMRYIDWNIPIFWMQNETEKGFVKNECYNQTNKPINGEKRPWPLCAIEMSFFNFAAGNTEMCLRRNNLFIRYLGAKDVCNTIYDENIYAFVPETNKSKPLASSSVLVLAARMDSFSLFSYTDPGAVSALSNVIAMLTIAEAMGRNLTSFRPDDSRRVMFVLFNGEAMDYIGSSRMVWDMGKGEFPDMLDEKVVNQSALFNLSHIDLFLELNQLVPLPSSEEHSAKYYLHVDPKSIEANKAVGDKVKKACSNLLSISGELIEDADYMLPLPPASLHSFLKQAAVPGIVITNHKTAYTNQYYNSFLDTPLAFNFNKTVDAIAKLSDVVVQFIADWAFNKNQSQNFFINRTFLETVAKCFWQWPGWNCSVIEKIIDSIESSKSRENFRKAIKNNPSQRTYSSSGTSSIRLVADYMMKYVLGNKFNWTDKSSDSCEDATFAQSSDDIHSYFYMKDIFNPDSNESLCVVSAVETSVAESPAFEIEDYDFSSKLYSTWAESTFVTPRLRMFLKPDPEWEESVLLLGLLIFLFSMVFVFVVAKGADTLFTSNTAAAPPS